jgi:hypothetical protein
MLRGRFGDTTGRPYIEAHLSIPSLQVSGSVSFLIDTGSDCTVLMQLDAARLKINYSRLSKRVESTGIGGLSNDFVVPAALLFSDPGVKVYGYNIELRIASPKPELRTTPSLLGRDVINHWRMVYHPAGKLLSAEVLACDKEFPIS